MINDRISVNALCFPGADWSAMTANWNELGTRHVSFPSPLLPDDTGAVLDELERGGHVVESITHPFLTGLTLDADDDVLADARARLSHLVTTAARLGARSIYLVTGGRGGLGWEVAAERFCNVLAPCVQQADEVGLRLLIEPVASLYADLHLATSLHDTSLLAEMAGTGICLDIFAAWTEANLEQQIRRLASQIHLVQISDYVYGDRHLPSRAVPGDGDIPLDLIISWLSEAGYTGRFDLELLGPRIDAEGHFAATRRAAERVGALLEADGPASS
jgi:sugar phosphate isomerase/epimerase